MMIERSPSVTWPTTWQEREVEVVGRQRREPSLFIGGNRSPEAIAIYICLVLAIATL